LISSGGKKNFLHEKVFPSRKSTKGTKIAWRKGVEIRNKTSKRGAPQISFLRERGIPETADENPRHIRRRGGYGGKES